MELVDQMDETSIEKYVGFPESLDAQERSRVEELIRTNDVADKIAAFYRSFYAQMRGSDTSYPTDSSQKRPNEV